MTAHDHAEFVPGCYRCDLSGDEVGISDETALADALRDAGVEIGYTAGAEFRRIVALRLLSSDWLRNRDGAKWDDGWRDASDIACGCLGGGTDRNPYREAGR